MTAPRRIAAIEAFPVRVPFRVPFATASRPWAARASWLVRVTDAAGQTGWGEAALEDDADLPVLAALLDDACATGLPPAQALLERAGPAGRAIRAAIDAARLDMLEQAPEARALRRPDVGVNATLPGGSVEATASAARAAVEAGYRTLKLKAAPDEPVATLAARFAAVRAEVGEGVALRLDANGSWTPAEAEERLRAIAPFRPQYVEQPLSPSSLAEAGALRAATGVALAADEAVTSVATAGAILDAGAADVLVVKAARVGGPAVVSEIALLAAAHGVPVVVSSLFETGVGLAAALSCAAALPDVPGWPAAARDHGLATAGLLDDDLVVDPLVVEGGRMRAPFGAGSGGFGVTVDMEALARYEVELAGAGGPDTWDADDDDDAADEDEDDAADEGEGDAAEEDEDDAADDRDDGAVGAPSPRPGRPS